MKGIEWFAGDLPGRFSVAIEIADELEGEAQENEDQSHSEDESTDLRSFFDEERLAPSEDLHGDSDRLRLSLFAQELPLNRNKGALDDVLSRITQQLRVNGQATSSIPAASRR